MGAIAICLMLFFSAVQGDAPPMGGAPSQGAPSAGSGARSPGSAPATSGVALFWLAFILVMVCVPQSLVCNRLANAKNYNPIPWTVCGLVPFLGFYSMMYMVGVPKREADPHVG